MPHEHTDEDLIRNTRNTARFFVETRHISWVLLIATVAWGIYGYTHMPQRKVGQTLSSVNQAVR
ncbi:MAG: hypothetical protein ABSH32_21560 [Bryobacteraceae bacterium]|jgi:hypothetical protein